jgi:hypothetical protein
MSYTIVYTEDAELDIIKLRKSGDKQAIKKLEKIIEENP